MRMAHVVGEAFLKEGLWFGNIIVELLERLFPSFREKEQDLYSFRSHYLMRFNLAND